MLNDQSQQNTMKFIGLMRLFWVLGSNYLHVNRAILAQS